MNLTLNEKSNQAKEKLIFLLGNCVCYFEMRFYGNLGSVLKLHHDGRENENCLDLYSILEEWFDVEIYDFLVHNFYPLSFFDGYLFVHPINRKELMMFVSLHETTDDWEHKDEVVLNLNESFLTNFLNLNMIDHKIFEIKNELIMVEFELIKGILNEPVKIKYDDIEIHLDEYQQSKLDKYAIDFVYENMPDIDFNFECEKFITARCDDNVVSYVDIATSYKQLITH
jgi:hypothetical protein